MIDTWLEPAAPGDDRCAVCWTPISQFDVGPASLALCILGTLPDGKHVAARRCICRRCRSGAPPVPVQPAAGTIVPGVGYVGVKPWVRLGMSQSAWYKFGRPAERPADYSPRPTRRRKKRR